jgi:hypothetical protein
LFLLLILSWHQSSKGKQKIIFYMEKDLLGVKNENGKIIISPNRHGIQELLG